MQFYSTTDTGGIPEHEFQDKPRFPGATNSCYTEKMDFVNPNDGQTIPVYRVMDRNGGVFDESHDPKVEYQWECWGLGLSPKNLNYAVLKILFDNTQQSFFIKLGICKGI